LTCPNNEFFLGTVAIFGLPLEMLFNSEW
jgi:hypothetical protein